MLQRMDRSSPCGARLPRLLLLAALMVAACRPEAAAPVAAAPMPAEIEAQLLRYVRCFSFDGGLDPADSDGELGRLCAPEFRMGHAASADGDAPPAVTTYDLQLTLGLCNMMHVAAGGGEPVEQDYIPAELAAAWVAFAQHKPRLVLAEVLEHHPVGDAAYVTLVHDYHDGLPDAVAVGGQAHYRSLLTWVLDQDGWRLRDKVWVDAPR